MNVLNFSDFSWIGVITASIASSVLGGLWFTVLFWSGLFCGPSGRRMTQVPNLPRC